MESQTNHPPESPAPAPAHARSPQAVADQVQLLLRSFGYGSVLDIGFGSDCLVRALLAEGVDAHGCDSSDPVIAHCAAQFPDRFKLAGVLRLPYADQSFDTVVAANVLEGLSAAEVSTALQELRRVSRRNVLLTVHNPPGTRRLPGGIVGSRRGWEKACFEAGLRKHPDYYAIHDYASLQHEAHTIVIPLETVPPGALAEFPLARLAKERGLHMDMLRESGSRSDAHVVRYHLAAQFVRPGDVVVDAACGLGYGAHLLGSVTLASQIIGIDASEYAIRYAQRNFQSSPRHPEFRLGLLPEALRSFPDHSVDLVISFETLEHVPDPESLLREFHRVLTPGGRVIVSVPNDWRDQTGKDPNPFHLHVYDAQKIREQMAAYLEIERVFAQTADRAKRLDAPLEWVERPRSLVAIAEDTPWQVEAEWWLVVGAKSVVGGEQAAFVDRVFSADERAVAEHALAFERDYENPWLVRAMISIGLRTENARLLERWATQVMHSAAAESADYGAALCVLAYRALETSPAEFPAGLAEAIDAYLQRPAANPNVGRWQVSLSFVQAQRALRAGDRPRAKLLFERTLQLPAGDYSPTLLIKTAEAAWRWGLLEASDGDSWRAAAIWKAAAERIQAELGAYLAQPRAGQPPDFLHRELANLQALLSRLVTAAKYAPDLRRQPRVFYQAANADPLSLHAAIKDLWASHADSAQQLQVLAQAKEHWEQQACHAQQEVQRLRGELAAHRKQLSFIVSRELSRIVRQGQSLFVGKKMRTPA